MIRGLEWNGWGDSIVAGHEIDGDWVVVDTRGWDWMSFLLVHAIIGNGGRFGTVEGVEEVQWCNIWC